MERISALGPRGRTGKAGDPEIPAPPRAHVAPRRRPSAAQAAALLAAVLPALGATPAAAGTEVHLPGGPDGGPDLLWLLLLVPLVVALFLLVRREPTGPRRNRRRPNAGMDGEGGWSPTSTPRPEPGAPAEAGLAAPSAASSTTASTASTAPSPAVSPAARGDAADEHFAFYEETFRNLVRSFDLGHSDQERSYLEVIGAMVATAHARDHETLGHSFRVARYAVALAGRMGIDGDTLTAVEWGALLHDVGKIAVPEGVLRKRGPLTEEEMAVMREHPRRGYQMLKGLLFLGTGLDIVLSHHERWDGRGYPNGLAGQNIPLPARIFAVVDTYDAITSDRPYRAARPHGEAAQELLRVSGSQLDPQVVERFLEIPEKDLARLQDLTREVPGAGPDAPSLRAVFGLPEDGVGGPFGSLRVSAG